MNQLSIIGTSKTGGPDNSGVHTCSFEGDELNGDTTDNFREDHDTQWHSTASIWRVKELPTACDLCPFSPRPSAINVFEGAPTAAVALPTSADNDQPVASIEVSMVLS